MSDSLVLSTLQRTGWGDDIRLEPLGVTGNNHVLLAETADRTFLVKQYFQHPDDPRNRIERVRKIVPESSRHEAAIAFVHERLAPAWAVLRRETERAVAEMDRTLAQSERCISPSDFGFHNTIRSEDGRLRFFDFEYAGWDDPAKTVCDFFCQPAVPIPNEWLPVVLDKIHGALGG